LIFILDTGVRSPSELVNIKVSDFDREFLGFRLRDEVSKTFGRDIDLRFTTEMILDYVDYSELKINDYIFTISPAVINRKLHELGKKLFGDSISKGGASYSELSLYDFRHISCCLWTKICKDPYYLMKRFGWKKMERIYYYSEFIDDKEIENLSIIKKSLGL
jgi:integrase